jgi:hypothetical protein
MSKPVWLFPKCPVCEGQNFDLKSEDIEYDDDEKAVSMDVICIKCKNEFELAVSLESQIDEIMSQI